MIPGVDEILEGLASGQFTLAQAKAWMRQHLEMARREG
jgi:hypothetical protein